MSSQHDPGNAPHSYPGRRIIPLTPDQRPIPTGRGPIGVEPLRFELCPGSQTPVPFHKSCVARCPVCGWLDLSPGPTTSIAHGVIGPHLAGVMALRRTFPNRSGRIRLMADCFFGLEGAMCTLLSRIHPLGRLPLWFAFTCLQTFLIGTIFMLAGFTQLPAIWAGRMDDTSSPPFGEQLIGCDGKRERS